MATRTTRSLALSSARALGPRNVYYQDYTAKQSDISTCRFVVDCPPNMLLDAEVYIEYTISVTDLEAGWLGGQFEGFDTTGTGITPGDAGADTGPADPDFHVALAQGFAMHKAMSEVELMLNEERILQYPSKWAGVTERFYASPEELNSICSMSGGALDSGNFIARRLEDCRREAVNVQNLMTPLSNITYQVAVQETYERTVEPDDNFDSAISLNLRGSAPRTRPWYNPGYTERFSDMARRTRYGGYPPNVAATTGLTRYSNPTGVTTFTISERLPVAPFMCWASRDKHRNVPNLRRIDLRIQWAQDAPFRFLMGQSDNLSTTGFLDGRFDWHTVKPVLHLRWLVPPASMQLPPVLTVPFTYYKEEAGPLVTVELPASSFTTESFVLTFQNRIRVFPRRLFLYFKSLSAELGDASEHHLEIQSLQLTVDGVAGKLNRMSSAQMFALYVENSPVSRLRTFKYDEWRRRYCTVVLAPHDIGWDVQSEDGRRLTWEFTVRSNWNEPAVGPSTAAEPTDELRTYQLFVMGEYVYDMTMDKKQCTLHRT